MNLLRVNPIAPVRIVHIGLGSFFKAHQAWYTEKVDVDHEWGIVAFTGRKPNAANEIMDQNCVYTLVVKESDSEKVSQVESISFAYDGSNMEKFLKYMCSPSVAIVTITITESGYRLNNSGEIDRLDLEVIEDFKAIQSNRFPQTPLFRIAFALNARRLKNLESITLVSCDNYPNNGKLLNAALSEIFQIFGDEAVDWLLDKVSFVSTSVDRITPKLTCESLKQIQRDLKITDPALVVTEGFTDWILQGDFPKGRPKWENAGAKFVSDIEPYESRKLLLLNGAHTLIAYEGLLRGYETVDQAIEDEIILQLVQDWWLEVGEIFLSSELDIENYCQSLLQRFRNSSISHHLSQIADDGLTKLRIRVLPVFYQIKEPRVGAHIIAKWIDWICIQTEFSDSHKDAILETERNPKKLIALLSSELEVDEFSNLILESLETRVK